MWNQGNLGHKFHTPWGEGIADLFAYRRKIPYGEHGTAYTRAALRMQWRLQTEAKLAHYYIKHYFLPTDYIDFSSLASLYHIHAMSHSTQS